jgi:hypothetical protein
MVASAYIVTYIALDAAADVEVADDLDPAGPGGGDEVVEDTVRHVLVEGALLPIRPHVELQRLQLHEVLVGDVADPHRREIGLAGQRAQAGELRHRHRDLVVTIGVRVRHHLERLRRLARHGAIIPGHLGTERCSQDKRKTFTRLFRRRCASLATDAPLLLGFQPR